MNVFDDFLQIGLQDHDILRDIIQQHGPGIDTYLASPAYFLLTGRKGLWIAQNQKSHLIICQHPNQDDQLLVFPPSLDFDIDHAEWLCGKLSTFHANIKLARVSSQIRPGVEKSCYFVAEDEKLMDWRYPSTVLDNQALIEKKGSEFSNFRNKIGKLNGSEISVIDINATNIERYRPDANQLINDRATSVEGKKNFDFNSLVEPNRFAYNLAGFGIKTFNASLIFLGDKPIALYTTERPTKSQYANGISLCVARGLPGASEYAYYLTAKAHFEAGYKFTCINGAETGSLEKFREKLAPVDRIDLQTYGFVAR